MSEEEKEALEILNSIEWDGFMITIKNLIDKQNKVIDEMINWIGDRCFYSDDCGNHCEIIEDSCYDTTKNWNCEDCIKQYFIRKVEGDGKN